MEIKGYSLHKMNRMIAEILAGIDPPKDESAEDKRVRERLKLDIEMIRSMGGGVEVANTSPRPSGRR